MLPEVANAAGYPVPQGPEEDEGARGADKTQDPRQQLRESEKDQHLPSRSRRQHHQPRYHRSKKAMQKRTGA